MACRRKTLTLLLTIPLWCGVLVSCDLSKPAFSKVHVCVKNEAGLQEFVNLMKAIAAKENLSFSDGSAGTLRMYQQINDRNPDFKFKEPVVFLSLFGLNGKNDAGILTSNFDLFPYQFSVGFLEGQETLSDESRLGMQRFTDAVVDELKQRWTVTPVPYGRATLPRPDCEDVSDPAPESP